MDIAGFRVNFPEFADPATYPDGQITFWSTLAEKTLSECAFGEDVYPYAVQLATAHYLAVAKASAQSGAGGGSPGSTSGPVTSKSLGQASVSYDAGSITSDGAGQWNATSYGRMLWDLMQLYGQGCVQL